MEPKLRELRSRLAEVDDLAMAGSLLHWDQATGMPRGGAEVRARQLATLARLAHEKFTDDAVGKLLDDLRSYAESLPYESDDASLIRVTGRDYERAIKIPVPFISEYHAHMARSYTAWKKARPENDFGHVRPFLEKSLDFSRGMAHFFPGYDHIADPLIDNVDHGMTASRIRAMFAELRMQLVPLVQAIADQPLPDDSFLHQDYPEADQLRFAEAVVRRIGYDFQRGRLDKTRHPFMARFCHGDVRITTRVRENFLGEALFSTLHEAGHALYEQNIDAAVDGTPLARGASAGLHESQSRIWENIVGRSRIFWEHFFPELQWTFPRQLGAVSLDQFYRAINKVARTLIRTDADEVTYNLHVMLRFDFELQLLEGTLAVADLPEAWNERFGNDFGIMPPDDRDGVLQDVHWYGVGIGGMFQGYTLGNILSAQFYAAARNTDAQIPQAMARGEFAPLRSWLARHVYQHGRKFTPQELVEKATGQPLNIAFYVDYLKEKFGELYAL